MIGVRPAADRAKPSKRRRPDARGEVTVGAPPTDADSRGSEPEGPAASDDAREKQPG